MTKPDPSPPEKGGGMPERLWIDHVWIGPITPETATDRAREFERRATAYTTPSEYQQYSPRTMYLRADLVIEPAVLREQVRTMMGNESTDNEGLGRVELLHEVLKLLDA